MLTCFQQYSILFCLLDPLKPNEGPRVPRCVWWTSSQLLTFIVLLSKDSGVFLSACVDYYSPAALLKCAAMFSGPRARLISASESAGLYESARRETDCQVGKIKRVPAWFHIVNNERSRCCELFNSTSDAFGLWPKVASAAEILDACSVDPTSLLLLLPSSPPPPIALCLPSTHSSPL